MKKKQRLIINSDDESVRPAVLMDSLGGTSKTIESQPNNERRKRGQTLSPSEMSNYFISVLEPKNACETAPKIDYKRPGSCSNGSSLNEPAVHNQSMSSNSLSFKERKPEMDRMRKQFTKIKQASEQRSNRSCKLLFENNNILEGIVKAQKIENLKNNFIKKIRRTSTCNPPVQYEKLSNMDSPGILDMVGIQMPPIFQSLLNLLSVLQIFSLLIIYSVSFVFEDLLSGQYRFIDIIQSCSLAFYFAQIVFNFISVKFSAGRKIEVIKDIIQFYVSKNFWIDFVSVAILLVDITSKQNFVTVFRMFIIFKLPQCLDKIEKIEVYFIRNVYNEQYWELIKVFIVNFCYAHVIALFMGAMANFNPEHNWLMDKGIANSPWLEQYVWSFYWATNVMLTVGFGDIVAVNCSEAICVIFIQTFSCIVMAYNINRVGAIITNIRLEDQNRSKKFKIFKKLTDQNTVSQELTFKINNYIEESSNIKKKFNYEEDQDFLKELPENLRTTYLKEANKEILNKLVFFKSLLDKTLCNFSQKLETRISHPQEIIRSLDDDFNLIILKKGHIGYVCKKNGCSFNDTIVDQIKVKSGDLPFLTSLDFISKIRPKYEIKSLQFSVLFTLGYETFIEIFRKSDMDYQLFCFLRDKCRNIPDQFEVMRCQFCQNFNHFKFSCPRLHYAPYEQHIINKYIYKEKKGKNQRRNVQRFKPSIFKPMQYYKKVKGYRDDMVKGRTRLNMGPNGLCQTALPSIGMMKSDNGSQGQRRRSLTYIEKMFDERAKEMIEMQLMKKENEQNFNDQIWIMNLDLMTNYNSYFSEDNPKYLEQKFSRQSRVLRKKLHYKMAQGSHNHTEDDIESMIENYKLRNMTENFNSLQEGFQLDEL